MSVNTSLDPRATRRARGLSLREVARRMRLSAPYISDLERGQRPWNAGLRARYDEALDGLPHAKAQAVTTQGVTFEAGPVPKASRAWSFKEDVR